MSSSIKLQYLSKKSIKEILNSVISRKEISEKFIEFLQNAEDVKMGYTEDFEIYVFDAIPALFRVKDFKIYIPTLYALNYFLNTYKIHIVPSVVVDHGAIEPLKRGADVMMPGIKKINQMFKKEDIVGVLEPQEKYFIVVGIALIDSNNIVIGGKGKCIANISRLDDKIWRASLQLAKSLG
ncbi:PUA domain containing protein [Ignisphaera aggregans DSM 17230]|uniref:PUA domain containing protein n=1 Tax=Ignisphaera aggregans (strain DSM 17230 / JCM 13409 / AQ1.S1) TaxID=583356 RepID=E0SQC1_IGNAA|nr:PUA domain containing protein [Ignisphaera aggregans DSM 17230]